MQHNADKRCNHGDEESERSSLLRPIGGDDTKVVAHIDANENQSTVSQGRVLPRVAANVGATLAIVLMIASWVGSGELVQGLTVQYPHPFAICFVTRLSWCALLVGWAAWRTLHYPWVAPSAGDVGCPLGPFKWIFYIKMAAVLSMVGLMSGYTWYISLDHTPLPSNTAVYQTSPVLVFAISIPVLGEKVTAVKIGATAASVVGAVLVSMGRGSNGHSNSTANNSKNGTESTHITREGFGFAMCAVSTCLYACFEVAYKRLCTDSKDPVKVANAFRFVGLTGAMVVLSVPLFPILHYTNVEPFDWPTWDVTRCARVCLALQRSFVLKLILELLEGKRHAGVDRYSR